MANTVAGGVYLDPDGKTYHDAEGKPVGKDKVAELEKINAVRAQQARLQEEALRLAQIAALQPQATAQALALQAVQQQMQSPVQVPPVPIEPTKAAKKG